MQLPVTAARGRAGQDDPADAPGHGPSVRPTGFLRSSVGPLLRGLTSRATRRSATPPAWWRAGPARRPRTARRARARPSPHCRTSSSGPGEDGVGRSPSSGRRASASRASSVTSRPAPARSTRAAASPSAASRCVTPRSVDLLRNAGAAGGPLAGATTEQLLERMLGARRRRRRGATDHSRRRRRPLGRPGDVRGADGPRPPRATRPLPLLMTCRDDELPLGHYVRLLLAELGPGRTRDDRRSCAVWARPTSPS